MAKSPRSGRASVSNRKESSAKAAEHTWDDSIQIVLSEAEGALHYAEIAERILTNRLRRSVGATPAATVASHLSNSLRDPESPYLRVGRGEYALKSRAEPSAQSAGAKSDAQSPESGALRAFGMYWKREAVDWNSGRSLIGTQGEGATSVNFADQIGVYLLHDRERVIYIGRATDTLFGRLKTHTTDRLGGRWDRFSCFGLHGVDADGRLSTYSLPWNQDVVIETMEALLIESLEPPLNRRRGDNFSSVEYIQIPDSNIEKRNFKNYMTKILDKN